MNFHQLSELLFNNYLLADSRTLQLVLHQLSPRFKHQLRHLDLQLQQLQKFQLLRRPLTLQSRRQSQLRHHSGPALSANLHRSRHMI